MLDYVIPFLTRTFAFDPNSPLLFTQFYFWGFFAFVFAALTLIKNRILLRNAFLFATSMFFYYKWQCAALRAQSSTASILNFWQNLTRP